MPDSLPAQMPALLGALLLAIVLTANFFVAAWRLNLVGLFDRRRSPQWRQLIAGALAAALPWLGALAVLAFTPPAAAAQPDMLAIGCACAGYGLHRVMDFLVHWASPDESLLT